jgi:hypothetical protein
MQGPAAHEAGVVFPTDEALQKRMMVVGNLSKSISAEQVLLRSLYIYLSPPCCCGLRG